MPGDTKGEITSILEAANAGQPGATQELFSLVYCELKKIAKNRIASNHLGPGTTSLVHETFAKMVKDEKVSWSHRHHFFWAAARAMRDILVEQARRAKAWKRGGGHKQIELNENLLSDSKPADLLDLNDALKKLALVDAIAEEIVVLKFFAGLTHEQIAKTKNLSRAAVWRKWDFAKAWIFVELGGGAGKKNGEK